MRGTTLGTRVDARYTLSVREFSIAPREAGCLWQARNSVAATWMTLSREICPLEPVPDQDPRAPASEYRFADGTGTVGFIASVSRPFCLNCNRIRLTADGHLRYCLFALEEFDLKGLLRGGVPDGEIEALIRSTVEKKWLGHEINQAQFVAPPRPMYAIGG